MRNRLVDLDIRPRKVRIALTVGGLLLAAFTAACGASAIVGREPAPVRWAAGGAAVFLCLVGLVFWGTRNRRPRWLAVNQDGLRLLNRNGRTLIGLPWGDVAGVGLLTNEYARRRRRSAASLEGLPPLSRLMVSVPVWLEIQPTGPDAVERHPELATAWAMGGTGPNPRGQCWLIKLTDSWAEGSVPPVEEHVKRWQPRLWRGHRYASALFGWTVGQPKAH